MTSKTIFITGAASGIGKATALQFHQRGWFVGAVDVDEKGLAVLEAKGFRYVEGEEAPLRNRARMNEDRSDVSRTLSADEVAAVVWEANRSDKLHWYVPAVLVERNRAGSVNPEKLRDELVARQNHERV